MSNEDRRGVALGGFMGTGKSTVGRALARRLELPFVDLDELLTQRHGPIPRQFAEDGEAAFRERERAAVRHVCEGPAVVVATGGGAWVDPRNRERLKSHFFTVVLTARLETLQERVGQGPERPLWREARRLLDERAQAYGDARLHVDTDELPIEGIVEAIVRGLEGGR